MSTERIYELVSTSHQQTFSELVSASRFETITSSVLPGDLSKVQWLISEQLHTGAIDRITHNRALASIQIHYLDLLPGRYTPEQIAEKCIADAQPEWDTPQARQEARQQFGF